MKTIFKKYYARFTEEKEGGFSIDFPNVDGAYTQGETINDGLHMAKECLGLHIYGLIEDGDDIPEPPNPENVELKEDQTLFEIIISSEYLEYIKSKIEIYK